MRSIIVSGLLLAALFYMSPAHGGEVDRSGRIELQSRTFWHSPAWDGQDAADVQGTVISTTEFRWRNAAGDQRTSVIPFLRLDATDAERSLVDLQEAYWAVEDDGYEILVGANTVFWGVTESVHLVDIINQSDFAGDIDGEDKLGQPMARLTMQHDWGEIGIYVMPLFRERTFAGRDGRFRPPLPVEFDNPVYQSSHGAHHVDLALRYSHYFGDIDIGLNVFSGTSREPRFVPASGGQSLLPVYDQIEQFGLDLQYTRDAWLWKMEAIVRNGAVQTFAAATGGFEYTFYQVRESAADVGLLLEYQHDGRNDGEPVTVADNDLFVGARLAFNDSRDSSLLAGYGYDTVTGEGFLNIEAERRLAENWFGELRLRMFTGAEPGDPTYWLQKDDYVELSLARYY